MDDQLRQLLMDRAEDVPASRPTPARLRGRMRRRIALAYGVGTIALAALVAGTLVGIRSLDRSTHPVPIHHLTPFPAGPLLRRPGEVAEIQNGNLIGVDPTGRMRVLARCAAPCEGIDQQAWAPDGRAIAWHVTTCFNTLQCGPQNGIWVRGARGAPQHLMHDCFPTGGCSTYGQTGFSWSPDGARLVYVQPERTGDALYVVKSDGTDRRLLASVIGENVRNLQWSPDGALIAYVQSGDLVAIRPDGSNRRVIAPAPAQGEYAWSPDGSRIALTSSGSDVRVDVVNRDGSGEREVFYAPNVVEPPGEGARWSPDGTRLALVTTPPTIPPKPRDWNIAFWVLNADGSNRIALHRSAGGNNWLWSDPVWSPDGSRIAFQDQRAPHHPGWLVVPSDRSSEPRPISELVVLGWRGGT
jgi:dipeptidyl aminopeptidase/acylaminoacyl peptidase